MDYSNRFYGRKVDGDVLSTPQNYQISDTKLLRIFRGLREKAEQDSTFCELEKAVKNDKLYGFLEATITDSEKREKVELVLKHSAPVLDILGQESIEDIIDRIGESEDIEKQFNELYKNKHEWLPLLPKDMRGALNQLFEDTKYGRYDKIPVDSGVLESVDNNLLKNTELNSGVYKHFPKNTSVLPYISRSSLFGNAGGGSFWSTPLGNVGKGICVAKAVLGGIIISGSAPSISWEIIGWAAVGDGIALAIYLAAVYKSRRRKI